MAVSMCSLTAAVVDLRTRRVPNALTCVSAVTGLVLALTGAGRVGVVASIAGGLIGLALMLPGYLFGGTGGGDVKLLAAIGTFLGPRATLTAFIGAAIAGGVIALGLALRRGRLRATLQRLSRIGRAGGTGREDAGPRADHTFAYAPAIALGALAAVLR